MSFATQQPNQPFKPTPGTSRRRFAVVFGAGAA
jgi:hypothetical protein